MRIFLADDERKECRGDKKNRNDDTRVKERLLKPAARMKTSREVVAEGATRTRRRLLKQDGGDEQDREAYLYVGQ